MAPRPRQFSVTDVRLAIFSLEQRRERPTVNAVRAYLGGGSTALIGDILRDEADMKSRASALATKITVTELFDVVTREVSDPMESNGREHARALLAGYLGEHRPATASSLRDYVAEGLSLLALMPENAIHEIDNLQTNGEQLEDDFRPITRETILWLRAFAVASQNADIGDVAITLAEDWIELNELGPE